MNLFCCFIGLFCKVVKTTKVVFEKAIHLKYLLFIHLCYRFAEGQLLSEASIDFDLVKAFLQKAGSKILENGQEPTKVFKALDLVKRISNEVDHNSREVVPIYVPKNVALLLFHPQPDNFFRGARTDVRVCTHEKTIDHSISGPIDQQIERVMTLILTNTPNGAYPEQAVREIVTNAFLHRGYEESYNDPVEVKITPNFIDVYSYPGPDPSLKEKHFSDGNEVPKVKPRNRRILDFFKNVKLAEGWNNGIATTIRLMKENNNPAPVFSFTPESFHVRLASVANCNAHLNVRREDANGKDDDKSGDNDDDNDDDDDYHGDDDDHGYDDGDGDGRGSDYNNYGADDVDNEENDEGDGDGRGSDYNNYGADDVDNEENNQRYEDIVGNDEETWSIITRASQRQPQDEHRRRRRRMVVEHSYEEMQETPASAIEVGPPDGCYGISERGCIVTQETEIEGEFTRTLRIQQEFTWTPRIPQEWPETAGITVTETLCLFFLSLYCRSQIFSLLQEP